MNGVQNRFDRAIQLDDEEEQQEYVRILTSKLESNGSSSNDQAWKSPSLAQTSPPSH